MMGFVVGLLAGLALSALAVLGLGYWLYGRWRERAAERKLARKRRKLERLQREQRARQVGERLGYLEGFQECYDWLMGEALEEDWSEEAPEDPAERAMWEHRRRDDG